MNKEDLDTLWLNHALSLYKRSGFIVFENEEIKPSSAGFRQKCIDAAELAVSILKLRKERQRTRFAPLSFKEYILGLAKLSDVNLAPVLTWFGVKDLSTCDVSSPKALADLAQGIDMSLRETLAQVRIGFAMHSAGPAAFAVSRVRSTSGARSTLEECETALKKFESNYDVDKLRELRGIELRIREGYEDGRPQGR